MAIDETEEQCMSYDPVNNIIGGFGMRDGTIDFYLRIKSLLSKDSVVLDFGAGRASWFEDDSCEVRKKTRMLKGFVATVYAADIDPVVLKNKASDVQFQLADEEALRSLEGKIDLIVADYVLEHINDEAMFVGQIDRLLAPGGWFCARTPHRLHYVAIAARLLRNKLHVKALRLLQPSRNEIDVFPTRYHLNSMKQIRTAFAGWDSHSFIYRTNPAYFFGSRAVYMIVYFFHQIAPAFMVGNMFIFLRKPQ